MTSGIDFYQAAPLLPFILLVTIGNGTYYMLSTGFEFTNNTKPLPILSFTSLVVLVMLSISLFPQIGIFGILTSMITAQFSMAFMSRYFAVRRFYIPLNWALISGFLTVAFSVCAIAFSIQSLELTARLLWITLGVLLIAFAGYLILAKTTSLIQNPYLKKIRLVNRLINSIQSRRK